MGAFVIVMPLRRLRVGDGFARSNWPLHVTVVGNFQTETGASEFAPLIAATVGRHTPLDAIVGGEAWFGPDGDILVSLIEEPVALAALQALHGDLLDTLAALPGFALEMPDHAGVGFRPHITVTASARARPGDALELRQVAVVNMTPEGADRLIRVVAAAE